MGDDQPGIGGRWVWYWTADYRPSGVDIIVSDVLNVRVNGCYFFRLQCTRVQKISSSNLDGSNERWWMLRSQAISLCLFISVITFLSCVLIIIVSKDSTVRRRLVLYQTSFVLLFTAWRGDMFCLVSIHPEVSEFFKCIFSSLFKAFLMLFSSDGMSLP